jgi:hypothetical protein
VLWVSPMAVILIVRVPNRPSRPKLISIPSESEERSELGVAGQRVRRGSLASRSGSIPEINGDIGAGLQKIGCGSDPLRSVGYDLTRAGSHRVHR